MAGRKQDHSIKQGLVDIMTQGTVLTLEAIDLIEARDLSEELPKGAVSVSPRQQSAGADHEDFGLTAAAIILSAIVIHPLAVWLAKRKVTEKQLAEAEMTLNADSVNIRVRIEQTFASSEAPPADVVEALKTQLEGMLAQAG